MADATLVEVPLVGVGFRGPLADWILSGPEEVHCLEITAEHFFDSAFDQLRALREMYPLFVHGLGLSLGTPGPLDAEVLAQFRSVVETTNPLWISEHVAFTRSAEVDLGHLNPIAMSRASLQIMVDHARQLSDICGRPLILENITSHLSVPGELSEPDFLNELCEAAGCGLLLDITNLFINAHNHGFDPAAWLSALDLSNVVQLHVVGYAQHDGVFEDHHGSAIQDELFALVRHVVSESPVRAVIIERDSHFPAAAEMAAELRRLEEVCESARLHNGTRPAAE